MSHCDKGTCLLVKVQDRIHHQELFFHRNAGVIRVECILLQETKTNHTGNLKDKFLIIREYVASDQFYNLKKTAFLIQKCHQTVAVINEFRRYIVLIPVT